MIKRLVVLLVFVALSSGSVRAQRLLIAAASDLKYALDSLVLIFRQSHPKVTVDIVYGSSGKLYEQISHGAPFDLYFSADIEYPKRLESGDLIASDVIPYGNGRIVFWSRKFNSLEDLIIASDRSVKKIAIANPQHAPYGRRAVESLRYYGIYDSVERKLVFGENISQAAQFATTGAADAGILALSLVLSPTMKALKGNYWIIPETAHKPLEQAFVILKASKQMEAANRFKDFMESSVAKNALSHYGFGADVNEK